MTQNKHIDEGIKIIQALGLPREQHNERSALCLLALVGLTPDKAWKDVSDPLMGITPIMTWSRDHYGKEYAPNTRETFRRQSMHQFVSAGLAVYNPDNIARPVNSPNAVYQIEPSALELLRTYGTLEWDTHLKQYLTQYKPLAERYAMVRDQQQIPVVLNDGTEINLTPGDHSILIKAIIEDFASRFAPGSQLIYAGDTGNKWGYYDKERLASLGVELDSHGKMPDVILYFAEKGWLLLVESVTSHGPVDGKRHDELKSLFSRSSAGLVYVTAFPSRALMTKYLGAIAWETEVWVADAPSHLIHFNGDKFLGPHS